MTTSDQAAAAPAANQPLDPVTEASNFITAQLGLEAVLAAPSAQRAVLAVLGKLYLAEVHARTQLQVQLTRAEGSITTVRQALVHPQGPQMLAQMGLDMQSAPQWLETQGRPQVARLKSAYEGINGNVKEWADHFAAVLQAIQAGSSVEALQAEVATLGEQNTALEQRLEALEGIVAAIAEPGASKAPGKGAGKGGKSSKGKSASTDTLSP